MHNPRGHALARRVPLDEALSRHGEFGEREAARCLEYAAAARKKGVSTEVYLDTVKMKKQMAYANAQHIPFVALVGESELAENRLTLKNMETGEQQQLSIEEALAIIEG